jgi:hypothetical protein
MGLTFLIPVGIMDGGAELRRTRSGRRHPALGEGFAATQEGVADGLVKLAVLPRAPFCDPFRLRGGATP